MSSEVDVLREEPELADERTALLASPNARLASALHREDDVHNSNGVVYVSEGGARLPGRAADEKPLPKMQIFLLCLARVVEPLAFFSIFPFVNKMIWELGRDDGLSEGDVGFWSGLIESLFSLTQMFLMIPWGRAADVFGRKPVLVASMCGVAAGTSIFGLSRTLWQMVLFRCISGLFAGTVVTIRVMITEQSTQKTQARAFSYFAFAGNLGILLGPIIGGALANPADNYPSVFGNVKFVKDFPYALATFATGAVGAIAVVTSALFVKETLVRKGGSEETSKPMSMLQLIKSPGVAIVLLIYGYTMLLGLGYTAIVPVFYFTPVELGGLGLNPIQISIFMAVSGVSQSLWLLVAFPPLQKRFGTVNLLRACGVAWALFLALLPMMNLILRQGWVTLFWIVALTLLFVGSGVAMAFTGVQLALNDVAPSPNTLGTLNAMSLTMMCGIRAFAPATFTSLFAISVKSRILGGNVIWTFLVALGVGFAFATFRLPATFGSSLEDDGSPEDAGGDAGAAGETSSTGDAASVSHQAS